MVALVFFAFLAGAATALSPCVLPVLPVALSAGATGGRRRPLGVVCGLTLSFAFATVALVYVIDALGLPDDLLRNVAIAVLLGFGIALLAPPLAARVEAWIGRVVPAPKPGADRDGFVDALHSRFHARVEGAVAAATEGAPQGAERLCRGVDAYLDVCLADRAVKALALEARSDPTLSEPMARRHERFAASAVPSFKAMGWPDARASAQLLAAMTAEIAVRELDAGRRLPAARRALRRFLGADEQA